MLSSLSYPGIGQRYHHPHKLELNAHGIALGGV